MQNGLVLHFDCAVTPIINNTLRNLASNNVMSLTNAIFNRGYGGSLDFIANTSYSASITDTTDRYLLTSSASICGWIYTNTINQGQSLTIAGKWRHSNTLAGTIWSLGIVGNGNGGSTPQIISNGVLSATSLFSYNKWQYVCATWSGGSGGTTSLYNNGSFLTSGVSAFNTQEQLGQPLTIARGAVITGLHRLSTVKIYNRALSAAEIAQNFNVTRNRFGV